MNIAIPSCVELHAFTIVKDKYNIHVYVLKILMLGLSLD